MAGTSREQRSDLQMKRRRFFAPHIFLSHGTRDKVLPIDRTSRTIVPELERRGYDVRYREFEGPHTIPADLARDAFRWFKG